MRKVRTVWHGHRFAPPAGHGYYDLSPVWLATWSDGTWLNGPPAIVKEISHDTRTLQPGDIFIALRGRRFDGHDFVEKAFHQGASGAIVCRHRVGQFGFRMPLLAVEDTREALHRMAWGHRRSLSSLVIGVSGSVGKTTVKEMIALILESDGATVRSPASWNNEVGLPLSILKLRHRHRYGVFEVGINRPGEMENLAGLLEPDWAVVTCVGPVHLEFLGSVEEVARQKRRLLEAVKPAGKAFLDLDHEWFEYLRSGIRCRVVTVSAEGRDDADYWVEMCNGGHEFFVHERRSGESHRYGINFPGAHMIGNALFGIAVGREAGIPARDIAAALGRFEPPPMRWEVQLEDGVLFVNDAYNANPISMRAAISTFDESTRARGKWLVLGGMRELGDRTNMEHRGLGEFIAGGPWSGVLLVGELGARISSGLEGRSLDFPVICCRDALAAARTLVQRLERGDAVLLKGSRRERIEAVLRYWHELRGRPFSKSEDPDTEGDI